MRQQFNPNYRLRNEQTRILLCKLNSFDGISIEKFTFVHPLAAILLTMFDGKKTTSQIVDDFSYVADLPKESAGYALDRMISELKEKIDEDILVPAGSESRRGPGYDPSDFVVPAEMIDLHTGFQLNAPLTFSYDVTHKCGRHCIYCYAETNFAPHFYEMPLQRVKRLLCEAREVEVIGIPFAGGDPFARKDFVEIIGHAIDIGINYFVSTKAALSRRTCSKLKERGLARLQISIDSANESVADFMTGSKGFFRQALATIRKLQEVGIEVIGKAVVTSYNAGGVVDLCQLLYDQNVRLIRITAYGRSIYRHSDSLFASVEQLSRLQDELEAFKGRHPDLHLAVSGFMTEETLSQDEKEARFKDRSLCTAGKQALHVLPDGKVTPCEQLPTRSEFIVGDLSKQSLMDIWNSDELQKWTDPDRELYAGSLCHDCPSFADCGQGKGRCYRNAFNLFGTPWAPDPNCPKLESVARLV